MPTNQPVRETEVAMDWNKLGLLSCIVVIGLAALGGLFYAAWWAISQMSRGALIAWALVELALLPLVGFTGYSAAKWGYKLGKQRSDDVMTGIGLGSGSVADTAGRVADVKTQMVRQLRQPEPVRTVEVQLPVVDVVPRRLPAGQDVVDL